MNIFRNLILQQKKTALPDGVVTGTFYSTDATVKVTLCNAYYTTASYNQVEYIKVDGELLEKDNSYLAWPVGWHTVEIKYIYDKFDDEDYGFFFSNTPYVTMDVSSLDVSKLYWFQGMFRSMPNLVSIDLSNWGVPKQVNAIRYMFQNCSSLKEIKYGKDWAEDVFADLTYTFQGCTSIKELDLSMLSYTDYRNLNYSFTGMTSVKKINISGPYKLRFYEDTFYDCPALEEVDLSGVTLVDGLSSYNSLFNSNCTSLKTVKVIGCDDTTVGYVQSMLPEGTWTLTDGVFTKS